MESVQPSHRNGAAHRGSSWPPAPGNRRRPRRRHRWASDALSSEETKTSNHLRLALAAAVITLLGAGPASGQEVSLPLGTEAPPAALEDLDGNPVQLLDLVEEGKPTLIEFWASWCEQCEALQPRMNAVRDRFGSEVTILAVAVAVSQTPRRVKRHLEDHDPGYPFLWDGSGEAVRAYQVPTTSVVILLDRDGKVAYTGSGGRQDLVGAMEKVVGGSG